MMRIGEVAKAADVSVQTLRFYERNGLLNKPSRLASSYRTYSPETVQIVRFIKQSQELGYTLAEIKQLLSLRDAPANSAEIRTLAQAKLYEVESKINRLQQMREELTRILAACECGEVMVRCPVLDTLNHSAV